MSSRCTGHDKTSPQGICIGADLYAQYRAAARRDAILPLIALLGFALVLVTYVVSIRTGVGVYRRDRSTGLDQLRVGLVRFVGGAGVALLRVYFVMVRAGDLVTAG